MLFHKGGEAMQKIAGLLAGLLLFISMFIAFPIAQAAIIVDNETPMDMSAATSAPLINPAASPRHDSPDYGFTYLTYRIKRGDNLTDIARRHSSDIYKISVDELLRLNNIKNQNRILAGQKLQLPVYYAKEVRAVMPAAVRAAAEAAIAPKEAALVQAKNIQWMLLEGIVILFFLSLFIPWIILRKELPKETSETKEPEKFLSHKDEVKALLPRCTGWDVLSILEAELVEIPRNPGSAIMNKKKLINLKELIHNNPELFDMPLGEWNAHLAAKINGVVPAKETA